MDSGETESGGFVEKEGDLEQELLGQGSEVGTGRMTWSIDLPISSAHITALESPSGNVGTSAAVPDYT